MEKIPTATLCVRVRRAPLKDGQTLSVQDVEASQWEELGLVTAPPDYNEGAYCTMYCINNQIELEMYDVRPD